MLAEHCCMQTVAAMNLDNFVVRPQRQFVEKFAKARPGKRLGLEDFNELTTKVAGLPTELADEDEEAKRFDMLVLRTQLAILQARPDFASLREKIQAHCQRAGRAGGHPGHQGRDGADSGGGGRRVVGGCHRPDAGDRPQKAARPGQADSQGPEEGRLYRTSRTSLARQRRSTCRR